MSFSIDQIVHDQGHLDAVGNGGWIELTRKNKLYRSIERYAHLKSVLHEPGWVPTWRPGE